MPGARIFCGNVTTAHRGCSWITPSPGVHVACSTFQGGWGCGCDLCFNTSLWGANSKKNHAPVPVCQEVFRLVLSKSAGVLGVRVVVTL